MIGRIIKWISPTAFHRWRAGAMLTDPLRAPVRTPHGFRFAGLPAMETGNFEPEETDLVRHMLPEHDLLVAVGANTGYFLCHAAHLGIRSIGCEPHPGNVRQALANLEANDWMGMSELLPVAICEQPGQVTLFGAGTGASLRQGWAGAEDKLGINVPAHTLDGLLAERLTGRRVLLVIDVEGAELEVLRGATAILGARPQPTIMVEICFDQHQPKGSGINPGFRATFDLLWAAGYQVFSADQDKRLILARDVEDCLDTGRNHLGIHNFLAVPAQAHL